MAYTKFPVRVRVRVVRERYILCWDTNAQNMAVPYASDAHIIKMSLFNVDVSLKPFSKENVIVQYVSAALSSIFLREAVRASTTMKYADSDTKLAKTKTI